MISFVHMLKEKRIRFLFILSAFVVGFFAIVQTAEAVLNITVSSTFRQNLTISGALSKVSGTFVIDHPLKPFTHLLYHSFVESPKVLNMYQGEVTLDAFGKATITLPDYFNALNTDYEYYLEPIGEPMPELHVASEIEGVTFGIGGGKAEGQVSWHVSGVRRDPYILANPIIPEVEKTETTDVKKGECIYEPLCE